MFNIQAICPLVVSAFLLANSGPGNISTNIKSVNVPVNTGTINVSISHNNPIYQENISNIKEIAGISNIDTWKSNNRDYDWYLDQYDTGNFNYENCGPTVSVMATKWALNEKNTNISADTVVKARENCKQYGGWWTTDDIQDYLFQKEILKDLVFFNHSKEHFKEIIDEGNIFILCINTKPISYNDNLEEKTGRFYPGSEGHFIIVKGYVITNNNDMYLETYDPGNWNRYYDNEQPKGKDRYYKAEDIIKAMEMRWNGIIVVKPNE